MTTTDAAPVHSAPRSDGSLVRAEGRRFWHRRFIRILLLLVLVGYVIGVAIASTQFSKVTPELLAQSEARIQQWVQENNAYRDQCLRGEFEPIPEGVDPEDYCGPPTTAADFGDPADNLVKQPFDVVDEVPAGAIGVGFAVAVTMFLVGATWIGAEWSTRSMQALLFWEPRRLTVMAVKVGVLALAVAAFAALVQLLWLGTGYALGSTKGTTTVGEAFWGELVGLQARVVLLAVLSAVGGFALANLIRNTGAALGIGFVYFAVVETVVRILRPYWQEWLITDNAFALVLKDGWRFFVYEPSDPFGEGREITMSNLHGGVVLTSAVLVVLAAGVWAFKRRDLT